MTDAADTPDLSQTSHFSPGFLFSPFGWVKDWMTGAIASQPSLLADICSISHSRMHLIALALSHLVKPIQHDLAPLLLRGRVRDVLDRTLGRRPRGLKRALNNLSADVLSPEGYRRLVSLLDDPIASKFLAHAVFIDDDDLESVASIPVALRPAIISSASSSPRGKLAGALHFLVRRGAAASFDSLVDQLSTCRQPDQVSARIRALVEALPLPTELPPAMIGAAQRLDARSELSALAREWRNCIEKLYLDSVDEGRCAIYLWDDSDHPAVCAVERHGRLGWFLSDVRGPMNKAVEPDTLRRIELTFADLGIFNDAVARAILGMIQMDQRDRRRSRRR